VAQAPIVPVRAVSDQVEVVQVLSNPDHPGTTSSSL
jgi:hypothetical protein